MKSTHNTALAIGKSAIAALCMVAGTAVIMAACSTANPPAKDYSQYKLAESICVPAGNVVALEDATYIQRINSKGGQDLSKACGPAYIVDKLALPYQAHYTFWKAM